jgi:competence protein ComEA
MLLFLIALAVAGQGVRYLATRPGQAPGSVQLLSTMSPGSPTAQRDSAMQHTRPLRPDERIDVDTSSAGELARLPRVGLRLAKTIVADRNQHGPFGALDRLDRVPGIGPGLLKLLAPHVSFSGRPQGTIQPAGGVAGEEAAAALDLNTATADELDGLPGIGPAKARAIVRYREQEGPFTGTDGLTQVPGMSPAGVRRLQDRVYVK